MSYNEERGFDEMLHKSIPYLLFCYDMDQKKIVNLLRTLFDSINSFTFQDNYDILKKFLDDIKLEPERNTKLKCLNDCLLTRQSTLTCLGSCAEDSCLTPQVLSNPP